MRVGILKASLAICRLSNLSLLPEWLNGYLPSRAKPANRAAQRRAPGVDTITLSQGISIFETPTGVCERHSCEMPSTRDASHSQESSRHAKTIRRQHQSRFLAQSRRRPDQDRLGRRAGSPGRGICYPCLRGHAIDGLLDILPDVLAGIGRSSGPVMNSVASRCARRSASGDHDQTKPLTPQPPFKTSRADLQLRRAAGARTPLIPARGGAVALAGLWSAWLRAPYPHCARASDQPRLQADGAGLRQPGPGRSRSATFQLDESFTCSIDRTGIGFSSCCSMGFDPISSNHH